MRSGTAAETAGRPQDVEKMARRHSRVGWSVVPLRPSSRRPALPWRELQYRHAEPAEMAAWCAAWPDASLGATGGIFGIAVLDVDRHHGGEASLADWEAAHGPLPVTPEYRTGGGLVVLPPTLHPSGRRYARRRGRNPLRFAPPPCLLQLLRRGPDGTRHRAAHWRALARDGVTEGERNTALASFAGHLLWRGVGPRVALQLLLCWNRQRCRPPLHDGEVAGVVASIIRLHATDESSHDLLRARTAGCQDAVGSERSILRGDTIMTVVQGRRSSVKQLQMISTGNENERELSHHGRASHP